MTQTKIPTREELEKDYWEKEMSISDLAIKYKVGRDTPRQWMIKYNIPRRTASEAQLIRGRAEPEFYEESVPRLKKIIEGIPDSIPEVSYKFKKRNEIPITLPLKALSSKKLNASLTLVLSDLHLGDTDHLPQAYWSCVNNLINILLELKKKFRIKRFNIVCNGDLVCGREVYRYQIFRTLLTRGHWQVFLAEKVLKETINKISEVTSVDNLFLVKGTHETLAENYMLYLRKALGSIAKYLSKAQVIDVGDPVGHYNVLFTHGVGSSDYYPITGKEIRDLLPALSQYKLRKIPIERVCFGHTHWLTTGLNLYGVHMDVTGGFQKWEYTISQRPSGMILYLFTSGELAAIPIRPEQRIVEKELSSGQLEYQNLKYYGQLLLKHYQEEPLYQGFKEDLSS